MITSPIDFRDAVLFETYVLNRMLPVVDRNQSDTIDLRGNKVVHSIRMVDSLSGDVVDRLTKDLAPLLFGAAWKVLDLGIEFALNNAGLVADHRNGTEWSIKKKMCHAHQANGSHYLLTQDQSVWGAVTALYANTAEHRHCLIHRTASINSNSGSLNGQDRTGNRLPTLTLDEQKAYARIALLVAEGFASGGITSRNEDHLRYWLDQVILHTNKPPFGVGKKGAPVQILTTLGVLNGDYFIDIADAASRASQTFSQTQHFNILFFIPDGSGRQLCANLEDIPREKTIIDLSNLPDWLSFF